MYVCMYVRMYFLRAYEDLHININITNSSTKVNVKERRNVRVKETQSNIIYNLFKN